MIYSNVLFLISLDWIIYRITFFSIVVFLLNDKLYDW